MDVAPIVDALMPQSYDRVIIERLVAAFERLDPVNIDPVGKSIWSLRDEVCARAKAEGRGGDVLRAVHAALPQVEKVHVFARFVADHGDGSYEPPRASALTPVAITHLTGLTSLLGDAHLSDVAAWLWLADEAALARLRPIARAAAFSRTIEGVSSGDGEVRAFELYSAAFPDEVAVLRHVAKVTGNAAGQRGMCSAAAAWLAARHGLTLPAAPASNGWDGGVFEKGVSVGRLLSAVDQAHPALLAEVAAPLLASVWYGARMGLAARLFGRWDVALSVTDGDSFLEAASRGGLLYVRAGKSGKDGRASVKVLDAKKARAEVEKKVAAKEAEWKVTRTTL